MKLTNTDKHDTFPQSSVSDIAFLLMVFFILTTAWAAPHILRVSSGVSSQNVKAAEVSDIRITANGTALDGTVMDMKSLAENLNPNRKYRIFTEGNACYEQLVSVLDCLSRCHITKVQVVSDET